MIVRIERLPYSGEECLYDLSDGSLSMDPVGVLKDGRKVYSAEALLCDLECFEPGESIKIIVTGFDFKDFLDDLECPDTVPERGC